MWKLFRANSYTVVRLLINQIALSLFSLMMVSVYTIFEHWSVQLIVGIFCAGFYLHLQYTVLWADGAKDRVRYDVDRAEYIKGKGFFLALFANSINILLGILVAMCDLFSAVPFFGNLAFAKVVVHLTQTMYLPLCSLFVQASRLPFFVYLLFPLPAIVVCGAAFELGCRNQTLRALLGLPEKQKKRKK